MAGNIIGNYETLRKIGEGAEGFVFEARCIADLENVKKGEVVALKRLRLTGKESKFERQAALLRRIQCPNVVRYIDSFRWREPVLDEEIYCLVTELLKGETLKSFIEKNPKGLSWLKARPIIKGMLDALVYCSQCEPKVVHRDLKPSNVYVTWDGTVKLIDFGIARHQDSGATTTGSAVGFKGSFDYMAPDFARITEDFHGDEQSDIYSFGVCVYHLLTGRLPFSPLSGNVQIQYVVRATGKVPELDFDDPVFTVFRQLRPIIAKCLKPDRAARYQNFSEVFRDFCEIKPLTISHGSEKYECVQYIGKGGFGNVYRARRVSDNADVAIKELLAGRSATRFIKEAKFLRETPHPNLVQYLDFIEVGDGEDDQRRLFIVLEFLEEMPGASLRERIKAEKNLDPEEVLKIFIQYLKCLGHLHDSGIIHRDIKPGNLYAPRGNPNAAKIFDLGIAHDVEGTYTSGQVPGSLDYMSPEFGKQEKDRGSRQSDIYSLGVTLYQALTGQLPFAKLPTVESQAWAAFYQRSVNPRPCSFDGKVFERDPELKRVLMRAIEQDPSRRYATAQEFEAELEKILAKWQREKAGDETLDSTSVGRTFEAPKITTHPRSREVPAGTLVKFEVQASGDTPLEYEWKLNGAPIKSGQGNRLTLERAQLSDTGIYTVEVRNPHGKATSVGAELKVFVSEIKEPVRRIHRLVLVGGGAVALLVAFFVWWFGRPPAPLPPPTPVGVGNLEVKSDPASIVITYFREGMTNRSIVTNNIVPMLMDTPYVMVMNSPGCVAQTNKVTLKDQLQSFSVTLEPLKADLTLTGDAEGSLLSYRIAGGDLRKSTTTRLTGLPQRKPIEITVQKEGYEPSTVSLVLSNATQSLEIRLKKALGSVAISSDPAGAKVRYSINGLAFNDAGATARVGSLPLNVPISFVLEKPGYESSTQQVTLTDRDRNKSMSFKLPVIAKLTVDCVPGDAEISVSVEGRPLTKITAGNTIEGLRVENKVLITAQREGYEPLRETVPITTSAQSFKIDMKPMEVALEIKCSPADPAVKYRVEGGRLVNLGATNRITGLPWGKTVEVVLQKAGYDAVTSTVKLTNRTQTIEAALTRAESILALSIEPADATVLASINGGPTNRVNGNQVGHLRPGDQVAVFLGREGYLPKSQVISISQQQQTADLKLTRIETELVLACDPPGAVFSYSIAGGPMMSLGTTTSVYNLPPRERIRVAASKLYYEPQEREIILAKDKPAQVTFSLQPLVGKISVSKKPSDATVSYQMEDGPLVKCDGDVIKDVPLGKKIAVTVDRTGYDAQTETVTLTDRKTKTLTFELLPGGKIGLNIIPDDALVSYQVSGGRPSIPAILKEITGLMPGERVTVIVSKPGYKTAKKTVTVDGLIMLMDFDLAPASDGPN